MEIECRAGEDGLIGKSVPTTMAGEGHLCLVCVGQHRISGIDSLWYEHPSRHSVSSVLVSST